VHGAIASTIRPYDYYHRDDSIVTASGEWTACISIYLRYILDISKCPGKAHFGPA
jgi:hypothetical protein